MSGDENPLAQIRSALEAQIRTRRVGDELNVDKLEKSLKPFTRGEIVAALKELEVEGVGRFISGRRGMPSRFAVSAPTRANSTSSPQTTHAPDQEQILHVFAFRDPPVVLRLPLDLTKAEAERISRWVHSLPIDDLV